VQPIYTLEMQPSKDHMLLWTSVLS